MWWNDVFLLVNEAAVSSILLDAVDVGDELVNLLLGLFFPLVFGLLNR